MKKGSIGNHQFSWDWNDLQLAPASRIKLHHVRTTQNQLLWTFFWEGWKKSDLMFLVTFPDLISSGNISLTKFSSLWQFPVWIRQHLRSSQTRTLIQNINWLELSVNADCSLGLGPLGLDLVHAMIWDLKYCIVLNSNIIILFHGLVGVTSSWLI